MFDAKIDEYNQYTKEYEKFAQKNRKFKYLNLADDEIYNSEIASALLYKSTHNTDNIFLIAPSIFNSPEILFISKENNFIENLRARGDVYLINWQESNKQLLIQDLVQELEKIIIFIESNASKKINLIGHCIGGNICLGIKDANINTLSLLTTPWDFAHLQKYALMREHLNLSNAIEDRQVIPKLYMQIMFFLMFPMQFNQKIEKYFSLPEKLREIFLCTEHWLQSGIDIPKSLFEDIINNFCNENVCVNKKWMINDKVVNIERLTMPICIIYAHQDQIVPYESIDPLQKALKNITLIKVMGGHISYLIKTKFDFLQKYNNWLDKI